MPFFGNDYDELRDLDRARFAKCNVIHRPANTMGDLTFFYVMPCDQARKWEGCDVLLSIPVGLACQ